MTDEEQEWVNALVDLEDGLYSGELGLIEDLSQKDKNYRLSEKQHDWLKRIYDRLIR